VALVIFLLILYVVLQGLHALLHIPMTIHQWHARHLAQRAQAITRKGLIQYSEGYWVQAKNSLIKAAPDTDTPLLNYLTAARAAQKMGDSRLRDHFLREAQYSVPEAKFAVELTQAQLQLDNHQWEQALATLRHLHDLAPNHPYVLQLLMDLYKEVRDWPQLIALIPALKKNRIVSEQELNKVQQYAYLHALIDLIRQNQLDATVRLFNSMPYHIKNDAELCAHYARFLIDNHQSVQAENVLKNCLRKECNPQLIEVYSILPADNARLAFAESLLKRTPHSAALFLCLGRFCMALDLWGKAQHYLKQSLECSPVPHTYFVLGTLEEQRHEPLLAAEYFKKGLQAVVRSECRSGASPDNL
jgi:HemY protein